ncbi:hypothetical protein CHUAL_010258 [Chamberlinius hualienensis]
MPPKTTTPRPAPPLLPTPPLIGTKKPRATINDLVEVIQRIELKFDHLENEIVQIRESIDQRLNNLQQDTFALKTNVSDLTTQIQTTRTEIATLTRESSALAEANLKNELLIYNLPLDQDAQSTVINYVTTVLNLPLTTDQISIAHTLPFGKLCPTIRLKLVRQTDRNKILEAQRTKNQQCPTPSERHHPFRHGAFLPTEHDSYGKCWF